MNKSELLESLDGIAIIGMAGRFPGAKTIDEFWRNIREGVESISFLSEEELILSGIDQDLIRHPQYVKARGVLEDIEWFDAAFFGFNPREAEIVDPQHRLFLEQAFLVLESAGYNGETYEGSIGVYAGASGGINTYFLNHLYSNPEVRKSVGEYQLFISNDKDFLPTRVSYKLNLKGPSVAVQTACSTSLVAVSMACQSLLNYQCDMALAGAASIGVPQKTGYLYQEGMILSPDGHCRAFDDRARGTVSGNGVGIVLLKRLEDAIADGDTIHAVIKGFAINNDGAGKVGYTAPSVEGQAEAIAQALGLAEFDPETITYVEAHGTGTPLGDPIEIAALTQAFGTGSGEKHCAIGSVKTNIGHLDTAAGIAGLIKTVQALKHQLIPPSLHFESPNPQIDFAKSPFYVNATLSEWKTNGTPRRAGVSSFGVGGTNAHVVLEEAPILEPSGESRPYQLLLLSAKTSSALETATQNLAEYFQEHPDVNLADVAYTLQVGRRVFGHRRMVVCQDLKDAAIALSTLDPKRVFTSFQESKERPVAFMFSGQGSQYVNMGWELYQVEPTFRESIDRCSEFLKPLLGFDLPEILYPSQEGAEKAAQQLQKTAIAQPAIFALEYALAQMWMSWGVKPVAAIGHSLGEYVAACLAGVFSLEDALKLVADRGKMMQQMPAGTMLAIPLSDREVQPLLGNELSLATLNGPSLCVVSGPTEAIAQLHNQLAEKGVECRHLHTSHAFHSAMMEPILEAFSDRVKKVNLHPPKFPYLSNVTGTWITAADATNPHYWARHLRQTVLFSSGLEQLLKHPDWLLLEVGPGQTLTTLARRHPDKAAEQIVVSSVRHPQESLSDVAFLLNALGKLWAAGIQVNWSEFYAEEKRYRIPLPTYPFERQRYWIEAQKQVSFGQQKQELLTASQIWQALVEAGRSRSQNGLDEFTNSNYKAKWEALEPLGAVYINHALKELGAFSDRDRAYSFKQLCQEFHILPRYEQLFSRCLTALVDLGHLQQKADTFTRLIPFSRESLNKLLEEVSAQWTGNTEMVELMQRCGEKFAGILTGEEDPLELLFTGPTFETLQRFYQKSPETRYYTAIAQAVVKALPSNVNLRILEVGAGTGSMTAYLLPALPPQRTKYTFTDVGPLFVKQAQQKFSAYPFMEYRVLDMDRDPKEQGYENHSFDLIIASQVLHATRNLEKTLQQVRALLAPEGIVLFWEGTKPQVLSFDVAFPLLQPIEEDNVRSSHFPFLSTQQWYEALRSTGFVEVAAFPETEAVDERIFIARTSSQNEASNGGIPAAFTELVHQKEAVISSTAIAPEVSGVSHSRPSLSNAYIAPRNQTELAIAGVWQKCLGIQQIGIHDNFFDLGGDSLLAVHILAMVRQTLQVKFGSYSLLNAPTIAALAALIENNISPATLVNQSPGQQLPSSLVKIKSGTSKPPLFLVHPAGGQVYYYRDLAGCVDPEQPVYGLQAQGVDGSTQPLTNVEEMATQYLEAVRVVQPEGPYFLGGSSFGGIVAFEMAQQLQAIGQKVSLLAVMDSCGPNEIPLGFEEDEVNILCILLDVGAKHSVSSEYLRQLEPDARLRYFLENGRHAMKWPADYTLPDMRPYFHLFRVNVQAMRKYVPQPYEGRMVFFRASERDPITPSNPESIWLDLVTGGVEVHEVPGNHITMNFSPNVQVMAERLKIYLDEAQQKIEQSA